MWLYNFDITWHNDAHWIWEQAPSTVFFKFSKLTPHTERSKVKILPIFFTRNHAMACHSASAGPTWTKIGTVKQLDPGNKPLPAFLQNLQIWPHTGRSKVKIFTFFLGPVMNEIFFFWWEAIFFNFWKKISFFWGWGGKKHFGGKFFFKLFF